MTTTNLRYSTKDFEIHEDSLCKIVKSEHYNAFFDKKSGRHVRFGKSLNDEPRVGVCEILDLEISSGSCLGGCVGCYKCNAQGAKEHNLTFEQFRNIFHKMPKTLVSIAFGITDIYKNKDFFKMMLYSKLNGVIPNVTIHGLDLDDKAAYYLANICGAVAVSIVNKQKSYDAIKLLNDKGLEYVNIHYVLSEESYEDAFELIDDIKSDERLKGLYALVFLSYKHKNPKSPFNSLVDAEKFKKLTSYAQEKGVSIGFDSCSAPKYIKSLESKDAEKYLQFVDPCESTIHSAYINCEGKFYACSFSEGMNEWQEGIDVLGVKDFEEEVWNHPKTEAFRQKIMNSTQGCSCEHQSSCRACPIYNIYNCRG